MRPPIPERVRETTFRVRFAETDMMGIVHHASYAVYFEAGRVEFSHQVGASYASLEEQGFSLAVSELQIRYVAAARFDQHITVRTWVDDIRSRSVTFGYEVVDAESHALLATGSTKHICIDHSGQVWRIPQGWYDTMRDHSA